MKKNCRITVHMCLPMWKVDLTQSPIALSTHFHPIQLPIHLATDEPSSCESLARLGVENGCASVSVGVGEGWLPDIVGSCWLYCLDMDPREKGLMGPPGWVLDCAPVPFLFNLLLSSISLNRAWFAVWEHKTPLDSNVIHQSFVAIQLTWKYSFFVNATFCQNQLMLVKKAKAKIW